MLMLFLSCSEPSKELPSSQLKTTPLVRAVRFGELNAFIWKPPEPKRGTIYTAIGPLSEQLDCFKDNLSSNELALLVSEENLSKAQQYVSGILGQGHFDSKTLECD